MNTNRKYNQKYRFKWESYQIFKSWLKPYPNDEEKAYCKACNVIINAHLCDLKKHANAKKHNNAITLLKTLKEIKNENRPTGNNAEPSIEVFQKDESYIEDMEFTLSNGLSGWPHDAIEICLQRIKIYRLAHKDNDAVENVKDLVANVQKYMIRKGYNYSEQEISMKYRVFKNKYYDILEKAVLASEDYRYFKPSDKYYKILNEIFYDEDDTPNFICEKEILYKENASIGIVTGAEIEDDPDVNGDDNILWTEEATDTLLSLVQEYSEYEGKNNEKIIRNIWQIVGMHMSDHGYFFDNNQCRIKFQLMLKQYHDQKPAENTNFDHTNISAWKHYSSVQNIVNSTNIPLDEITADQGDHFIIHKKSLKKKSKSSIKVAGCLTIADNNLERELPTFSEDSFRERVHSFNNTVDVIDRLYTIENNVHDTNIQIESQALTNSILTQIRNELSTLSNIIGDSREGITLVVPSS